MPTSISPLTELEAINQILVAIGQAPVTTLENTNPDVAVVQTSLNQVNRDIQAEGWSFNKESNYILYPGDDGKILIPSNALQVDTTDPYGDVEVIYRGEDGVGYLYNKTKYPRDDAYLFDYPVYCDIVWLYEWQNLPQPMKSYIVARTSTVVSARIVGDPNQLQVLAQYEAYARSYVLEYECNQGDYSMFGQPDSGNIYRPYQPYKALIR